MTDPLQRVAVSEDVAWMRVEDTSATGAVRRRATEEAARIGFREPRVGEIAIVASEVSTNLVKYARDGVVVLRVLRSGETAGLAVVALDSGPGIRDLDAIVADGESTSGSLGIGLGAVRRLADGCDMHSLPGSGTVVTATFWIDKPGAEPAAGLARPLAGENECGDAYAVRPASGGLLVMVADGLGHGTLAARASTEAVRVFWDAPEESPAGLLRLMHERIAATRGAAITVAHVDAERGRLSHAGVGNVAGRVVDGSSSRGLMVTPGIVGHNVRRLQDVVTDLTPESWVVLHSDGLTDKWDLRTYPGLLGHTPLVVATTLLRDAAVNRDDASVLVCPVRGS